MINAVTEQFSKFVSFAEEQSARGKDKAIATKGDVAINGGTTLEERKIAIPNACTILSNTKFVVTMTIKNVADADLGPNDMPEFAIDDIKQEMV